MKNIPVIAIETLVFVVAGAVCFTTLAFLFGNGDFFGLLICIVGSTIDLSPAAVVLAIFLVVRSQRIKLQIRVLPALISGMLLAPLFLLAGDVSKSGLFHLHIFFDISLGALLIVCLFAILCAEIIYRLQPSSRMPNSE